MGEDVMKKTVLHLRDGRIAYWTLYVLCFLSKQIRLCCIFHAIMFLMWLWRVHVAM